MTTSTHFDEPLHIGPPVFPFTAIVGQAALKTGLILNGVNSKIGGVLIRGEKGTAKSTAVRAFARLLPEIAVVDGCAYHCDPNGEHLCPDCTARKLPGLALPAHYIQPPLVELPVGATEDRVIGTLNLERAIRDGARAFEPGLLAAANRGILYVDEINLLSDHLVDVLLDAAAMGVNYVEREGISISHPAQFILVGTMNPEEGDLRPQLLDRFALCVDITGLPDPLERAEVVRRRIAFERQPRAFMAAYTDAEAQERGRIRFARRHALSVVCSDAMLDTMTRICATLGVDGLRGDIVMYKTAVALAAYAGRTEVTHEDVEVAAGLALVHRQRRQPFDRPEQAQERMAQALGQARDERGPAADGERPSVGDASGDHGGKATQVFAPSPLPSATLPPASGPSMHLVSGAGRRRSSLTETPHGRYTGSAPLTPGTYGALALAPTLRAAAPHQQERRAQAGSDGPLLLLQPADLQRKVRKAPAENLILFAVDASGSMAARRRMEAAKGAVVSLLLDAYQKRDRVGLLAFGGEAATLVLPPTTSVELAERELRSLPTGGRTPLAHALHLAGEVFRRAGRSGREFAPWLVLVTDGRLNVALRTANPFGDMMEQASALAAAHVRALVIDTESGPVRAGVNRRLARVLGGECVELAALGAGALAQTIRQRLQQ